MKKKKFTDEQRLVASFAIIVTLSMTMHALVFSRKDMKLRTEHYPTVTSEGGAPVTSGFLPQGPPVVGKVVAIGLDRYYVDTTRTRQMFYFGNLPHPDIGEQVRITYAQGTPPTVLKIERL